MDFHHGEFEKHCYGLDINSLETQTYLLRCLVKGSKTKPLFPTVCGADSSTSYEHSTD